MSTSFARFLWPCLLAAGLACGSPSLTSDAGPGGGDHDAGSGGGQDGGSDGGAGVVDAGVDGGFDGGDQWWRLDAGDPNDCANEPGEPNPTTDWATPLETGTRSACLSDYYDSDTYRIDAPAGAGGYYVLQITPDTALHPTVWFFTGHARILREEIAAGATGRSYWAAAPGASFALQVREDDDVENHYTMDLSWHPIDDAFEPNDDRSQASPIEVGTPVQAMLFAGISDDADPLPEAYIDWYRVTLAAGRVQLDVTATIGDVALQVGLEDESGTAVAEETGETSLTADVAAAGTYFVRVAPAALAASDRGAGTGDTQPAWMDEPYSLTVSQP